MTVSAQDCALFRSVELQQSLEFVHYNAKDKEVGSHHIRLQTKNTTVSGLKLEGATVYFDKRKAPVNRADIEFRCQDKMISLDLMAYFPGEIMEYERMRLNVIQNELPLPLVPIIGVNLPDAVLEVEVRMADAKPFGSFLAEFTERVIKRKEQLKTPAGSYACYRIESKVEITPKTLGVGTPRIERFVEFFSPEVGIVRVERYHANGKLLEYKVLENIK